MADTEKKGTFSLEIKSPAVEKFIDCVSKVIGDPLKTFLQAKADVAAELIHAKGDIQKEQLLRRAANRIAITESRRQVNIEAIAAKAIKELPETASQEPVSEDWTAQFFESCQDVGEEE